MSNIMTQFFYIAVMIVSAAFAFHSQKNNMLIDTDARQIKAVSYFLAFVVPCFVIAFTNIGSDYSNYYAIIRRLTWDNFASFSSEEPGINIFFLLVRTLANNNIDIAIFIVKVITCALFFISFYLVREYVKIGYSVIAYLVLVFLPSFYLLTIALAAGVVSIGMALFIFKKKYILPFLLILLAAQLHNSAYIFLPVFFAAIVIQRGKVAGMKRFAFAVAYILVTFFATKVYTFIQSSVVGFHYNNYGSNSFKGSGIMILVIYIPLAVIIYPLMRSQLPERLKNLLFVFAMSDGLFYILSYQFSVIERMSYYIVPLYSMLFPYVLREIEHDKKEKRFLVFTSMELLIILYLLFRGYLVFHQRTSIASGVGYYKFFNPFTD